MDLILSSFCGLKFKKNIQNSFYPLNYIIIYNPRNFWEVRVHDNIKFRASLFTKFRQAYYFILNDEFMMACT